MVIVGVVGVCWLWEGHTEGEFLIPADNEWGYCIWRKT